MHRSWVVFPKFFLVFEFHLYTYVLQRASCIGVGLSEQQDIFVVVSVSVFLLLLSDVVALGFSTLKEIIAEFLRCHPLPQGYLP